MNPYGWMNVEFLTRMKESQAHFDFSVLIMMRERACLGNAGKV